MSNKIIKITEENLRKAVELGDLKQLAPELFEKKKEKVIISDIHWIKSEPKPLIYFPYTLNGCGFNWSSLQGKPPMTMTLEWEE